MTVTHTQARTILRRYKRIDSWFISAMGMNLYRGCTHGCRYCDGQAERYRLAGEFGKDVEVKTNALEVLKRELTAKRRSPLPGGFVCIGGGVTDAWQPLEQKYRLARGVLALLLERGLPLHALTKSHRITNDLDLLEAIHQKRRATISFSFSTVDPSLCQILEPGASPPKARLDAMARIKAAGIPCGMFLMPVIPGVSDTEEQLTSSLKAAKAVEADYVIFSCLTLKPGRQQERFFTLVENTWPAHLPGYRKIFPGNRWGAPITGYQEKIHRRFAPIADDLGLALRIPDTVFGPIVTPTEKTIIILEHLEYLTTLTGKSSHFGKAARAIAQSKKRIEELLPMMKKLRGIGPSPIEIVEEIIGTGTARDYRNRLHIASSG